MMKKRVLLALGIMALLLLCSFLIQSSGASEVTVGATVSGDPGCLDPQKMAEATANTIIQETQEGLVRLGPGLVIQPAGATKWEVSKDGLTWTFHLRDYSYSDGVKVKAQDFVYAAQRLFDPETAGASAGIFYCIKGGQAFNSGKGKAEDVGVKALDDKTVQYTLTQSVPYFEQLANFICLTPARKDIVAKAASSGVTYGTDPKGMVYSGPFVLDEWVKGSKMVLKKNPKFWDAKNVKIDKVIVNEVPELATREQLFESKQIDILPDASKEFKARIQPKVDKGEFILYKSYYPTTGYIAFNCQDKNKLFTNKKVRLAFSLAIDREGYCQNIIKNDIPAYGFLPYGLSNGKQIYREVVPEPLKAMKGQDPKALFIEGLKELGMDPDKQVEITFLQGSATATQRARGEFFMNQWQTKLGVKVGFDVALDGATFNQQLMDGNFQIAQSGWGADYNDPMTFMELGLTGSPNSVHFMSNKQYDDYIKEAAYITNMKKRLDLFTKAEKIFVVDEAAVAPLNYQLKTVLYSARLIGCLCQPGGPAFELRNAYVKNKK